jgi:hypothetical protein
LKTRLLALTAASLFAAAVPTGPAPRAQDARTFHGESIPPHVEAMYARGLQFLAQTQADGGSWGVQFGSEPGVVGLAVLAMLAHGEDPNHGPYARHIRAGIDFIIKSGNAETGYIGTSMYNHGFATLALAEAYGALDDERVGPALRKAVDLILDAQKVSSVGAWRYSPESSDGDTTVSGAQMVALYAARNAGLKVPDEAIKKGLKFYVSCQSSDGGFGYSGAGGSNAPRTAIGALVFALERQKEGKPFKAAMRYLKQSGGNNDASYPFYYEYYAAQAFFHGDMDMWRAWNEKNITQLQSSQAENGAWEGNHGPVFSTAAALLSLAVNYRFVPIYER